jgi:exopolysaccharide biosynthesis polyprenyl glycosylphosphotransferase
MAGAVGIGLVVSGHLFHGQNLQEFLTVRIKLSNFIFIIAFAVVWHFVFRMFGLYRSRRIGLLSSEWWDISKAVGLGTLVLSGLAPLLHLSAINRGFIIAFFLTSWIGTILERTLLRSFLGEARRNGRNLRNLVIVGCGPRGSAFGREVRGNPELGYMLLGYIDEIMPPKNPLHGDPEKLLGHPDKAKQILQDLDVDEVVISLPIKTFYSTISKIISVCEELGLVVRLPADFFESRLVNAYIDELHDTPVLTLRAPGPPGGSAMLKRAIDFSLSLIALVFLSPLLAVIALLIKVDSRGPVFFIQERVGAARHRFDMMKFRTMCADAEIRQQELEDRNEVEGAAFKIENDPRVTRVGRVLRKLSLDELPQLINVFKGEMSLVGPRPLPLRDVSRIASEWQNRRFSVKPGLTCLWQINGRHKIDFDHWMELDLEYIDNWSMSLDLDILLKTVPAVIRGTGAS